MNITVDSLVTVNNNPWSSTYRTHLIRKLQRSKLYIDLICFTCINIGIRRNKLLHCLTEVCINKFLKVQSHHYGCGEVQELTRIQLLVNKGGAKHGTIPHNALEARMTVPHQESCHFQQGWQLWLCLHFCEMYLFIYSTIFVSQLCLYVPLDIGWFHKFIGKFCTNLNWLLTFCVIY